MQKRTIIISAIILVVAVFGFSKTLHYTSSSGFCSNCHVMEAPIKAWAESSHKDVECMSCHTKGTLGSYLKAKIGGVGHVYAVATNAPKHFRNPDVSNEACLNCHAKDLKFSGRFDHEEILKEGIKCVNCHASETHGIIQ